MTASNTQQINQLQELTSSLETLKAAYLDKPMPSASTRIRRLDKLNNVLIDYKDRLITAVNSDFNGRSTAETLLAEYFATLEGIAYNRKRLRKWMKPQRRETPMALLPAKVEVMYQPLGVIGIVVPWNFPIFLCLSPLIGALAAGNRAMIKTSEFAPATSRVIKEMLGKAFREDEVKVIEGGVEVSTAFTQLPFDHLVFTGATNIGKLVMASAAPNLTPVTLELGGKSPVIIHKDFPVKEAAKRLAFGKAINAGQICVSPDYVFCPTGKVDEFVSTFTQAIEKAYPTVNANKDFTSIINDRQLTRLKSYIEDAREKGATIVTINPSDEDLSDSGKLPMTLILGATDDMLVLQEEIFGPLLPVIGYDSLDETISYINSKPRPLALYYFDWNTQRSRDILEKTHSGGVCINDTLNHVTSDDIPFGGVGPSGMGHYHGKEGFLNFSKAKGVVTKGKIDLTPFIAPPWNKLAYNVAIKAQELRFRKKRV